MPERNGQTFSGLTGRTSGLPKSELGQREGDYGVAKLFFRNFGMAAGGDDQILLPGGTQAVSHRCGVAACGKLGFPQLLAGFDVKTAENAIGGAGDENDSARGDDGPAEADGA